MKITQSNEILYHIGFSREMIENATMAILLDDIRYVEPLAKLIDPNAKFIADNREYLSYLVTINDTKVLLISMGYGSPAMGIGLEELGMVGLRYFIRIGECGAIDTSLEIGDFIIAKGSLRNEGTSPHYAPLNYPAAASFTMIKASQQSLDLLGIHYKIGIVASTDTTWPMSYQMNGEFDERSAEYQHSLIKRWQNFRILAVDNTTSALLTMTNVFNLKAVAILDVVAKTYDNNKGIDQIHRSHDTRLNQWQQIIPLIVTQYINMI